MKALIILADNVYLTPYLSFYTTILDDINYDYKIVYWDKNCNEVFKDKNFIRFSNGKNNKHNKAIGYLKYRKFILGICKKESFNILIPLHTIVSFILYRLFVKSYKRRYVYDVRDYSYEKFFIFRLIQNKLVKESLINIISSKGYRNFLPNAEYFVTHNIPKVDLFAYKQIKNRNKIPIQISYIGLIRFMEQNKRIIQFFKNDERFHLNFIGTNAELLQSYCIENGVKNVSLIGTFDPADTLAYYEKTDIIMNLYGNHTPLLDYALSNKLYYSASLYKPILVCEDTFMQTISSKYQIGFTLKLRDSDEKNQLENFMANLDREMFIRHCDLFMSKVDSEQLKVQLELKRRLMKK
ncbi:hypothetical protein SAMN04515624_105180 [Eubacterium maltosivorans]|uniref:capsular biosynthesis protein n=1 Tax=Eubacterium maltosivorans TaxID=2041044 RepID=UPI000883072F|nr:capsular biosynthesis protein [Eubacterium maltosivorans]WPK79740.1 hypothetical protein EUMA32_11490 [Eubacterium maltosivorans]SDP03308.1 hypothetical protein SAMN04515624_105180 [Eubacterium maltosivorans]